MTKFEELCWRCGVSPESEEAKAISDFVDEMIFDERIYHTDEDIFAAAIKRFRQPTIKSVYDFIVFFENDGEAHHRFVIASSEEEATEKLEAHFRALAQKGFQPPVFITNPTVEIDCVIA